MRRSGAVLDVDQETVLASGDVLALGGRRATVMEVGRCVGEEVDDKEFRRTCRGRFKWSP